MLLLIFNKMTSRNLRLKNVKGNLVEENWSFPYGCENVLLRVMNSKYDLGWVYYVDIASNQLFKNVNLPCHLQIRFQ